jgi:hypothetical protein
MVLDFFYSSSYALHNTVYLFLYGHVALPSAVDVLPGLGAPRASCTLDRKASICGLGRSLPACKHRHTMTSGLQRRAACRDELSPTSYVQGKCLYISLLASIPLCGLGDSTCLFPPSNGSADRRLQCAARCDNAHATPYIKSAPTPSASLLKAGPPLGENHSLWIRTLYLSYQSI